MIALLSFTLAGLLVLAGAAAATAALPPSGRLDRTLAFATVAISQVVVSTLVVGALIAELNRAAIVVSQAVIAALLVLLAIWRNGGRLPLPRLPASREVGRAVRSLPALVRAHPWVSALVAIAGAELLWRAFAAY